MRALDSDRASHFFLTSQGGEPLVLSEVEGVDRQRLTQVGRALRELGMQMIPAYSPGTRNKIVSPVATFFLDINCLLGYSFVKQS